MKDLQREQREMRARMKRDTSATVKEQQKSLTEAHFQQDNLGEKLRKCATSLQC
jgi:hypothetical protein